MRKSGNTLYETVSYNMQGHYEKKEERKFIVVFFF